MDPDSGARVHQITDGSLPTIHRFYDTSPVSPSGRYIAVTVLPYDDRMPAPGDSADVVVICLASGDEIYRSKTAAWDTQVGAHVQWGADDDALFFNRMDTSSWTPYGVRVDIFSGNETRLSHTVYMVSPDGRYSASPCLRRIGLTQPGYGVIIPHDAVPRNHGASATDGLYLTDNETGESVILISFRDLLAKAGVEQAGDGAYYGFHVKWSPCGSRIMFIVRLVPSREKVGRTMNYLFVVSRDGKGVALVLGPESWEGGHHPNWCPDGKSIVMNLIHPRAGSFLMSLSHFASRVMRKLGVRYYPRARRLSFVEIDACDGGIRVLAPGRIGSGHPTVDPKGKVLVTDCYPSEAMASRDGTVPIRAIRLESGTERCLFRMFTRPRFNGPNNEYRIDPHPAWTRDGAHLVLNGSSGGCRAVFIADVKEAISDA